jgi:hypothetical protein
VGYRPSAVRPVDHQIADPQFHPRAP